MFGGVAITALVIGGATACKKDSDSDSKTGSSAACGLKLAFFGALSGDNAGLVTPMKNGAQLAIDQYNEKHKDCTVALVPFDSQGAADKAAGLATSAAQDTKIVGMIGPAFSGETETAEPILEQAGIGAISPSATRPSLSTKGWKVFHRGVGNDLSQGPAAASYIKNVMKAQKVFVVDDQSAYGAGLADEAKKGLGSLIVGTDKSQDKQTDFAATITKIKTSGATVLFYGGYTAEASLFLKQLRAASWTGTMVGGDGINDTNMIKVTGDKDVEGTIATCPCAPATAAKGTFVSDYKAKNGGADPAVYADVSYDLANVFLDAFAAGKTSRADVLAFLGSYNKTGPASGVTYKWESTGELDPTQVKVWAYEAKAGNWAPEQEIPKG